MRKTNFDGETSPKRSLPKRPLLIGLAIGLALLAVVLFVAARIRSGTDGDPVAHVEVDEHGEAGHDEHGEEEEGGHDLEGEVIKFEGDAAQTAGIEVTTIALTSLTTGIPFNGQIEPNPDNVAQVASLVPGRVVRLPVEIGDRVSAGQTLAVVESRAIGEAQSAYGQALARFDNAKTNLSVVEKQARAGVFSRGPIEEARKAQVEASGNLREAETTMRQARVTLENVQRQARAGAFASPALEAAKGQEAAAKQAVTAANASLNESEDSVRAARAELERRQQLAAAGAYGSRPVEEARRVLSAAQASLSAARSEVATTRTNLQRARTLVAEGLISQREAEAANLAHEQAQARLEMAQAEVTAAQQEQERQRKVAAANVAETAEVSAARSALSGTEAAMKTRRAEVQRAAAAQELAEVALSRERAIFQQDIANRREVSTARSAMEQSENAVVKARQQKAVADAQLAREQRIAKENLNNIAQLQTAQAGYRAAQADLKAARTALSLLKSSPNGAASVPVLAPIAGVVQEREVTLGEVITGEMHLMTIVNLDTVHVDAFLPERDVARVRIGAQVRATVAALPGRTFTGRIELIHTQVDPKTRTVEAHAEIANPGVLRPGMFARGMIAAESGGGQSMITVPSEAVQTMEGEQVVFVAGEGPGEYFARQVEVGETEGGRTVIKNGLKPGDRVVVKGAFMVKAQAMKAELGHDH